LSPVAAPARISHTHPSRGDANGPGPKARDRSGPEAYSKYVEGVEPSATPETGPFPAPQQEACEKCGLVAGRNRGLAEKYGGDWRLGPALAAVRHGITYRDLRVTIHGAELLSAGADEVREGVDSGWFDSGERAALPMSALVGKVLRARAAALTPVDAVARVERRDAAAARRRRSRGPARSPS
jgi:hypothetical protein